MTATKKTCGTCKKWDRPDPLYPVKNMGYCHDPERVSYSTHGIVAMLRSETCGSWEAMEEGK